MPCPRVHAAPEELGMAAFVCPHCGTNASFPEPKEGDPTEWANWAHTLRHCSESDGNRMGC